MKRTLAITLLSVFLFIGSFAQKYTKEKYIEPPVSNLKANSAACQTGQTITEISLNNVRTYIHMDGLLWTHKDGGAPGYEIPKGSGKTAIYAGGLWIGGTDIYGVVKLSAVKYKGGRNFWPGPLISTGDRQGSTDLEVCYQYDRHFNITRHQVEAFREWYNTPPEKRDSDQQNYTIPQIIHEWPAHANASAGYDNYLAPFWDNNDDGFYNPADGDYPFYDLDGILPCGYSRDQKTTRLYGDGTTWWVYNDRGNVHVNPAMESIGMEIRAQAFQFSSSDELNDMSFYNFEMINRSTFTLIETYFGVYVDADLGYGFDDLAGSNVTKGLGYFYNGLEIDGDGQEHAYGANPPAIGFDFFEGPYQDPNGIDDCSSYDKDYKLICNECILNGNITGLNFGDGIVDNERWGMTRSMVYTNAGGTGCGDHPDDYYKHLRGIWKDGERMRYGGNGHPAGGGIGPITNFIFPGDSDPCGWGQGGSPQASWSEETEGNQPADRRMVMSSGPLTLEPGAINDITIGVVWARSFEGGIRASVDKMLTADEKAQRLFDNCFQIIDGPDAPELTIIEQDKKFIFHIWNKPNSNNYLEAYRESDPSIVCSSTDPDCDPYYRFQGYQVWQLKDISSTIKDASTFNKDKARLIFQCDIQDGIGQIVNFEWNHQMQGNIPSIQVMGSDKGIEHTFVVEQDMFAKDNSSLINFKDYYYVAVAYAHNNFKQYDQTNPLALDGQKQPYKAGRNSVGGPIKVFRALPHKNPYETSSLQSRSNFGDSPIITQLEGHGNGRNVIDIDSVTHDAIMAGPPWKVDSLSFKQGRGPIEITIVDPMNVVPDIYTLKFDSVDHFKGNIMDGKIFNSKWYIYNQNNDTIFSESMISRNFDQFILEWGFSINITQSQIPYKEGAYNNGFLEATMEFADPSKPWLWFVKDDDRIGPRNWIRAGYTSGDYSGDPNAVFENVLDGTWTPFKQAYIGTNGVASSAARAAIDTKRQRLANVDLYFTSDRSKWTRSPVIETTDDEALSIGNRKKFYLRDAQSIDQWGNSAVIGSGVDSFNMTAANYLSETGLGWFPGYAIDVETGERLNIVYGESSWLSGDNGADMMWNPSPREGSKLFLSGDGTSHEGAFFGGKHYIYIMGHNATMERRDTYYFPAYDGGKFFITKINDKVNKYRVRELFINAMWCSIPILDSTHYNKAEIKEDPYSFVRSELYLRFRVVGQYCVDAMEYAKPDSLTMNQNKPIYKISTTEMSTIRRETEDLNNPLELIHIVPNPYYGGLENSENLIKLINLPKDCTISIYTLNGNLVKRISKESEKTYVDWDIKNEYGNQIASGVYIFHIDAPGFGEHVLKWFGAMRAQKL